MTATVEQAAAAIAPPPFLPPGTPVRNIASPAAVSPPSPARTVTIPREMLLRVLRKPVTRTDSEVTLLSEYAQSAADLLEQQDRVIAQLRKDLRDEQREAQRAARDAVAEDRWARAQGEEYGSY